ncbi:MAG: hypothetical protein V4495_25340 [Pseudomonadota bacterium]
MKIEALDGQGLFPLAGEFAGVNRDELKLAKGSRAPTNGWTGFTIWKKNAALFRIASTDK